MKFVILCKSTFLFSILFLSMPFFNLFADDGAIYAGEPKLKIISKDQAITLTSVNISLSKLHMAVEYKLINAHSNDIKLYLQINIPQYTAYRGPTDYYQDRSYSDLKLYINTKEVNYTTETRAIMNDNDITSLLLNNNIAVTEGKNVDSPTYPLNKLSKQQQISLIAKGIISNDKYLLPKWKVKTTYSCLLTCKANEHISIKYTYNILPGEFYFNNKESDGLDLLRKVGFSWDSMRRKYDGAKSSDDYYLIRYLNLPVWPEDWPNKAQGIQQVIIDAHSGLDTDGRGYLMGINLEDHFVIERDSLNLIFNNFKQDDPFLLEIKPLFDSKE